MPPPDQSGREWQTFLERAVHDLGALLRGIGVPAGLLSEKWAQGLDDDSRELLEALNDGVVRMDSMLKAIAEYSMALQMDTGSLVPIPADGVVRSALAAINAGVRDSAATIQYDQLPLIHGNWEYLAVLFQNLLSNAFENQSMAPLRVTVSAERDGDSWLFAIRDNGVGIDAQYLDLIFQPFQRLRGSDKPGAGLGLATCRRIVELHGGKIWVESARGEGSTFFFTLPSG